VAALTKWPVDGVPNVPLAWANQPSRCNGRGTRDQHDNVSPRPTQHCSPCPESALRSPGNAHHRAANRHGAMDKSRVCRSYGRIAAAGLNDANTNSHRR